MAGLPVLLTLCCDICDAEPGPGGHRDRRGVGQRAVTASQSCGRLGCRPRRLQPRPRGAPRSRLRHGRVLPALRWGVLRTVLLKLSFGPNPNRRHLPFVATEYISITV